jgi:hypothetical protein
MTRHSWTKRQLADVDPRTYWQTCRACGIERRCIYSNDGWWMNFYKRDGEWLMLKHVPICNRENENNCASISGRDAVPRPVGAAPPTRGSVAGGVRGLSRTSADDGRE